MTRIWASRRRSTLVYLLFLAGLTVYLTGSLTHCAPKAAAGAVSGYLGDQTCRECHTREYDDWQGSHHDLAMQEANDSTVLGNFDNAVFENKGISSRFFRRDGQFWVNTEGPDGRNADFQIAYTFGVTPLQQYLVRFPGGRMQVPHLAWDTQKGRWFDLQPTERFAPDDWMHWTKGSMTWNTMCADCHSTNLVKGYDPEADAYHTAWSIIDVSCEACHGPGERHVDLARKGKYAGAQRPGDDGLFQTAATGSRRQIDGCAPCHSLRSRQTPEYDPANPLLTHFVPEILRPNLYHLDGQIKEEVYVYGSFLQSKMYRNNVRCTNCHNPHSLQLLAPGNALCGQCHAPAAYDGPNHHFHRVDSEGAQCVNCHMPGKIYMGNDFRRDHSFRTPRPDLSVRFGTPNACTGCHQDKPAEWAARAVVNWYGPERRAHFSEVLAAAQSGQGDPVAVAQLMADTSQPEMVRATALWILGQSPSPEAASIISRSLQNPADLIRYYAVSAMAAFPLEQRLRDLPPRLRDSVRSVRTLAALNLGDVPERLLPTSAKEARTAADADLRITFREQADFVGGQLQQGQYYQMQGLLAQAEAAYRQAMRIDPLQATPYLLLADLHYQQGQLDAAEADYRAAIRADSTNTQTLFSLGLLLAERQRLPEALPWLERAARRSSEPRYYYNWGLTLQHLQRPGEAEAVYREALRLAPDSAPNRYALAILYLQEGKTDQARPLIEELLRSEPQNPQYQQLMRQL